jgi:fumarylacetoacetase
MNVGDLLGSGTISGTKAGSYGSLLEMCQGGKIKIPLSKGETRMFLEDGDTVILRGWCGGEEGETVGFGDCGGTIIPALAIPSG